MRTLLLALLLPQDEAEIRRAIERLPSPDPAVRSAAEETLRGAGAAAVPHLLQALEGEPPGLRDRVAELVRALSEREWKKRDEAMRALAKLDRHAIKHLQEHENASDAEVAWRVRSAIARIQDREPQDRRDETARHAAVLRILGEVGDARAVPALLKGLGAGEREVRLAAAESAAALRGHLTAAQVDEAAEAVLALYGEDLRVLEKSLLLRVLAAFRSPVAVKPLSQLLRDRSERNTNLKRNAIATLAAIGTPEALRAVVAALEDDDPYVRHAAVRHLEPAAGESFGYDPRASADANRAAVMRFREWWERKSGRKWGE